MCVCVCAQGCVCSGVCSLQIGIPIEVCCPLIGGELLAQVLSLTSLLDLGVSRISEENGKTNKTVVYYLQYPYRE